MQKQKRFAHSRTDYFPIRSGQRHTHLIPDVSCMGCIRVESVSPHRAVIALGTLYLCGNCACMVVINRRKARLRSPSRT